MVDINLIGDDKTGEEERVEEFTQTSSMDTQELAFEERTETFDTTKTSGLTRTRSYSSLISTLIIIGVIVLLSAGAYYFIFSGGDSVQQSEIPEFTTEPEALVDSNPTEDLNLDGDEAFTFEDDPVESGDEQPPAEETPARQEEPIAAAPTKPKADIVTTPRERTTARRQAIDPVSQNFLESSRASIGSVTGLMTSIPANLNTTLLSYAGERVRIELVGDSSREVREFADRLNRNYGQGSFAVVSEDQVAANGGLVERVLISGKLASTGNVSASEQVEFLSLSQAEGWIKNTCLQYGLELRHLKTEQSSFSQGYQKTPIFVRIYGAQSSIVGFLQELSGQNINLEVTKIQLVSPDMISYSDDNLVLIAYMFLHQKS